MLVWCNHMIFLNFSYAIEHVECKYQERIQGPGYSISGGSNTHLYMYVLNQLNNNILLS